MARQKGPVPISGTIDEITFYKTAESGFLARRKTSLDAQRLKKDPAFEGSRKASAEFARAATAARLLRHTLLTAGHELADTRIISRLTGRLTGIIATDATHPKGARRPDDADLSGLVGFEWNKHRSFSALCSVALQYHIDPAQGTLSVSLPQLTSGKDIHAPKEATHFELIMEGASCSFGSGQAARVSDRTGWLKLDTHHTARTLQGSLGTSAGQRMVLGAGVRFGIEVNSEIVPLMDKGTAAFVIGGVH